MVVFLVSECSSAANRLRYLLSQTGHDCPVNHMASYAYAPDAAPSAVPKPDLVVFMMSADTEYSLETLRRLRSAGDLHILAIGPRDSTMILGAVRAGAQDYLEEDELPGGLAAALARIAQTGKQRSPVGQLTTVISASGGCGKTSIATNLAVSIAQTHGGCGLFDFDLVGSDVATFLGLKPRHTLADLCRSVDKLDHNMWEQTLMPHDSSVSVLAGPATWDDARQIGVDDLQKILRSGRGQFSQVVVDLDSCWLNERGPILLDSTTILLLFRLDFASVRNATRAVQALLRLGIPSDNVHLVVSRFVKNSDITPSQAEAVLGMKIRHFVPEDALIVNAAVNCGVPVVTEAPRCPFAKAIGSIAEALSSLQPKAEGASHPVDEPAPRAFVGTLRAFLRMSVRECVLRPSQV
jgi:pilus assembly protein CpaE